MATTTVSITIDMKFRTRTTEVRHDGASHMACENLDGPYTPQGVLVRQLVQRMVAEYRRPIVEAIEEIAL